MERRRYDNLIPFKKGHPRRAGRKAGVPNKFTMQLKDCILKASEKAGFDGKGKDGTVGYLFKLAITRPDLYVRLLEKVLPLQVTGEGGGPIKVMALPPDVLAACSNEELAALQVVYERLGNSTSKPSEEPLVIDVESSQTEH